MTHWRFSWEKPRSVWIEGSATFTTAMSSTTMNWTVHSRARANHLRRDAAMCRPSFRLVSIGLRRYSVYFVFASRHCDPGSARATLRGDGQAVRPVLPGRPRLVARRRALGAARRARAAEGPAALHRPRGRPAGDRHERPRHAP